MALPHFGNAPIQSNGNHTDGYIPKFALTDGLGNAIESLDGAISIHDADVHHTPINEFFYRFTGVETTVAVISSAGATQLTVASTANLLNQTVQIKNGDLEVTLPKVNAVNGNIITLDRPLDNAYSIGSTVKVVDYNIRNTIGSLAAPISYKIKPDTGSWHIVTITIGLTHSTESDPSLFGNIAALTNGLVLRAYNGAAGKYRTFTNWKVNSSLGLDFGEVRFIDKKGGGDWGTFATGNIRNISGAVPNLSAENGDYLEVLVQDDLSGLILASLKVQGHIESQ